MDTHEQAQRQERTDRTVCGVAVIGAGAAGLLAGIASARHGARTVVLERNAAPGRKLALTGGGRCNYSNTLTPAEFVRRFGDPHAARLGHALRTFPRVHLTELLKARGVEGQTEDGWRLFTRSGRAADVVEALRAELESSGAELLLATRVLALARKPGGPGFVIKIGSDGALPDAPRGELEARAVVICSGGLSYPRTGATGDGYQWARALGHTLVAPQPALVGLVVEEPWPRELAGVAWPDAQVTLAAPEPGGTGILPVPDQRAASSTGILPVPDQRAASSTGMRPVPRRGPLRERGEILFTHFGVSGPAILDLSLGYVRSGLSRARLTLDFFPEVPREALDARLRERLAAAPRRAVRAALDDLVPGRLLEHLIRHAGAADVPAGRLTRATRGELVALLKSAALTVTGTRGPDFAEITVGGVPWEELHPATLASRVVPGLFFAGELLDVAGRCGGFNLQAAFSTGYLAGRGAAAYSRP